MRRSSRAPLRELTTASDKENEGGPEQSVTAGRRPKTATGAAKAKRSLSKVKEEDEEHSRQDNQEVADSKRLQSARGEPAWDPIKEKVLTDPAPQAQFATFFNRPCSPRVTNCQNSGSVPAEHDVHVKLVNSREALTVRRIAQSITCLPVSRVLVELIAVTAVQHLVACITSVLIACTELNPKHLLFAL